MSNPTGIKQQPPRPIWLRAKLAKWAVLAYRLGLGRLLARHVMVITTVGRLTGRRRSTPLWYARDGDTLYCISGWGPSSDWFKNLKAEPRVSIEIGSKRWETRAQLIPDKYKLEEVLRSFRAKYGRALPVLYHMDRLVLVSFPLPGGPG